MLKFIRDTDILNCFFIYVLVLVTHKYSLIPFRNSVIDNLSLWWGIIPLIIFYFIATLVLILVTIKYTKGVHKNIVIYKYKQFVKIRLRELREYGRDVVGVTTKQELENNARKFMNFWYVKYCDFILECLGLWFLLADVPIILPIIGVVLILILVVFHAHSIALGRINISIAKTLKTKNL